MNKNSVKSNRMKPLGWIGILMVLAFVLAACSPAAAVPVTGATATSAPVPTTAPMATAVPTTAPMPAVSEASISVATDATLGKILVDGKGMTLYMYTKDTPNQSNCSAGCLKAWPPLLTQGNPTLGAGVDAALIGNTKLADGTMIVTYNKMPLYYYAKDIKAGDVIGQNVGSVWFVVTPDGKPIGMGTAVIPTSAAASNDVVLNVATNATLGKILVDGKGMTLYMYTKDTPNQSNCSAGCLKAWPPFLTQGSPKAGEGVNASLIGNTKLADGTMIVTYNKMPLYYWASDAKAGDATGQGVGSVWYVVSPDGKAMMPASSGTGY